MTQTSNLTLYGVSLRSRLMLGTSQYPSPAILAEAARASGAEIVTVSLRRESARLKEGQDFWRLIRDIGARVLPNTAGCYSVKEAVTTAQMAREVFGTPWVKLEVIGEADTLQPDVFGLVEAARILSADGFEVFPYTTEDLVVAERLIEAGCRVLMPWGSPIGSGKGLNNVFGLRALRAHFPDVPLIVDAGLGLPSQAAAAMELGYDGVLLNTAVAKAGDPVAMARAFGQAIEAGRAAFLAGPMQPRDMAAPSTPVVGKAQLFVSGLDPFYPIVDSADWVARLVGVGAKLIQLRVKDRDEAKVAEETRAALAVCAKAGATLVVNDYWRIAIDEGAPWVHLGQGDLDGADIPAIRRANLRLGVSTHDEAELARALELDPDYVALGPIYPTILKAMAFAPAGAGAHRRLEARIGGSRSSPSAA